MSSVLVAIVSESVRVVRKPFFKLFYRLPILSTLSLSLCISQFLSFFLFFVAANNSSEDMTKHNSEPERCFQPN